MIEKTHTILGSIVFLFLFGAVVPNSIHAQDSKKANVVGVWNVTADTDEGDRKSTWTIEKSGDAYKGEFLSEDRLGKRNISNINLTGNKLTFEIEVESNGQQMLIQVDSMVDGNKLTGTWAAVNDGNELASGSLAAVKKADAKPDFDGSTLESFRGYTSGTIGSGWTMDDGVLHFDGNKSGDIMTKQEFGNFELEFDWKITEAGNSGVMYRVSLGDKKPYKSGPEYQILDDDKHKDGKLESHRSGSLYALYVPKNKTLKPVGQWNTSKIVLNGNTVEHWLNGNKVVEAELGSDDWNEKVAASKFKTWEKFGKNKKGHICFQDHGDPVWYRNIKIKSLD